MVRQQFTNSCLKDVSVFLKEGSPKDLEKLAKLAELYLNAHGMKLSTKAPVTKQDVKTSLPRTHKDATRCYVCDGRGHRAMECQSKASTSRNDPFGHDRRSYCFKCGAMGHKAQVEVLRDTGCSGVIIRRELVDGTHHFTLELLKPCACMTLSLTKSLGTCPELEDQTI